MPFFNSIEFGKQSNVIKINPFNYSGDESGFVPPPPGQDFMVTEGGADFMITETSGDFMITESL